MKIKKTVVPVAVSMLFLVVALSPGISTQNSMGEQEKLTIWMRGVSGEDYSTQVEISQEKLEELNNSLGVFLDLINFTMDENSPDGTNISVSEWIEIKNGFNNMIDLTKTVVGDDFPDEATKSFISSVIESLHGPFFYVRQPVISVGIGITWVPFYEYETLLGKLLRPVFLRHFVGFSATVRLNPFVLGFPYWRFGYQRVRTFLFNGLLINFGDLGINRLIGPQLLVGYGCFTGFIK